MVAFSNDINTTYSQSWVEQMQSKVTESIYHQVSIALRSNTRS